MNPGLQLRRILARTEAKPVSFLHPASLDPSSLGLKSVSLSLGRWETRNDGRKEVSRGKLLLCFLFFFISLTFSVNTRKSGIACFHANVNPGLIFLSLYLFSGVFSPPAPHSHSLFFSFPFTLFGLYCCDNGEERFIKSGMKFSCPRSSLNAEPGLGTAGTD